MAFRQEGLVEIWYQALQSSIGIEVQTSDAHKVRQKLYLVRDKLQDEDLASLSICESPFDPTRLWIVKKPGG